MFETPVLLLIFNRPKLTERVFEAIKGVKPKRLYVAADGPRPDKSEDTKLCDDTRKIIGTIDWDCRLQTLFRDENLGCGKAVSAAISWFFENEEMGIILEDDCLPDLTFFKFCEELLHKYYNDERIVLISGTNFQRNRTSIIHSYYFSRLTHVWGWASWKRVWKNYDYDLKRYENLFDSDYFSKIFRSRVLEKKYKKLFDRLRNNDSDTWDYQFFFANICQNGLSIIPNVNLIKNIGFDDDATHTKNSNGEIKHMKLGKMNWPLRHPDLFIENTDADEYTLKEVFNIHQSILKRGIGKLKKIIIKNGM